MKYIVLLTSLFLSVTHISDAMEIIPNDNTEDIFYKVLSSMLKSQEEKPTIRRFIATTFCIKGVGSVEFLKR